MSDEDGRIYPPEVFPVVFTAGDTVPPWLEWSSHRLVFEADCLVTRHSHPTFQYQIRPLRRAPVGMLRCCNEGGSPVLIVGQGRGVLLNMEPLSE